MVDWRGEGEGMEEAGSRNNGSFAEILSLVGGGLLAIGSFLTWARVDAAGASVSARGTDGSDGYITLTCGAVLLLYGIGRMTGVGAAGKRGIAVLAILAGLIGGGVGV